jgi:glycosyltransferase involved in cell wall biosynthesis
MVRTTKLALIGNSLPRLCGIATFTNDLQQALACASPRPRTDIFAMTDVARAYHYPPEVVAEVAENSPADYRRAAGIINAGGYDVASVQHEFGIFGGVAGGFVLPLLQQLRVPVVTTLHTVLAKPDANQRHVLCGVVGASARVVVMAEKGRHLLQEVYGVPAAKIAVIPHGVPDYPFVAPDAAKAKLGFGDRPVILTFGLLSPNKGIEVMIDAMPEILKQCPQAIYVVLGATHPSLVRDCGEAYRESLSARSRALGVEQNVVFRDQFVDRDVLLDFIAMSDVYVTPYLNEAQLTSGTLAYSFGLGKAIVSTPYWHAQEILADGRGLLVPFRDSGALSAAISSLLTDDTQRNALRQQAYRLSRSMIWSQSAEQYLRVFADAAAGDKSKSSVRPATDLRVRDDVLPEIRLTHFHAMCDDTGLFQHAVHSVPDRSHGYCVDDNARALLLSCALSAPGERPLEDRLTARFAAFIQHAWNTDTKRFRNFLGFDRQWLEPSGSEDSHGRTLWALGVASRRDDDPSRRRWAASLFIEALGSAEDFTSPRAWAFTLLGLDAFGGGGVHQALVSRMQRVLADRLVNLIAEAGCDVWTWFESGLTYDNARLSQALIATGLCTGSDVYREAGLSTLRWLMRVQSTPTGLFRPVGTLSFGAHRSVPSAFDQQPLEAAAAVSACLAARRAEPESEWASEARRAFAWFLGANDLDIPLVDIATGSCRDGLHADRANENRGGESILAYLIALAEIRCISSDESSVAQSASMHAANARANSSGPQAN